MILQSYKARHGSLDILNGCKIGEMPNEFSLAKKINPCQKSICSMQLTLKSKIYM